MVLSKQKGLIRDETYAIRLYESNALAELMEQTGFRDIKIYTQFSPHPTKGDYGFMNQRMILLGRKI
jgi:hypothetical protein